MGSSLGLMLLWRTVFAIDTLSVLAEVFATAALVSVNALRVTRVRDASAPLAPTIAPAMELANTSKTWFMPLLNTTTAIWSIFRTLSLSPTTDGMPRRPADASVIPNTPMLTVPRECALTEMMSRIAVKIFSKIFGTRPRESASLLTLLVILPTSSLRLATHSPLHSRPSSMKLSPLFQLCLMPLISSVWPTQWKLLFSTYQMV